MNMTTFKPFLLLVSLLALALVSSSVPLRALSKGACAPCAFRLTIKTWDVPHTGTTSNVSITVRDAEGNRVVIPNVVDWNRSKPNPGYVFFQPGNADVIDGAEDCCALVSHPCFVSVTITGTGDSPNWLLDYVIVDAAVYWSLFFRFGQWLSPHGNYTAAGDLCPPLSKGKTSFTRGSPAT